MPAKSRKVWSVLALLNKKEQIRFHNWLRIELAEKQAYVKKLLSIIMEYPDHVEDEWVWKKLYPSDPYNDGRLRKLYRDLCAYVEEFLAIESFRKDKNQKDVHLLRELREREAHDLFVKQYNKLDKELTRTPLKDAAIFRKKYQTIYEMIQYQLQYEHGIKPISFEELYMSFDAWWVHEKIALACTNETLSALFPQQIDNALLAQAYEMISKRPDFSQMALLQIHWKIHKLFQGTPESEAQEISQWIVKFAKELPLSTKKEIFELLLNYHIRKLNTSGDEDTARIIFKLYQWGINDEFLIAHQKLHWQQYKNIISVCLQTNNYESAWVYLNDLIKYLPAKEKEEAYIYNLSQYHIAMEAYEEVISALGERKFSKLVYEIPARSTLLQAYYELYGPDKEWLIPQLTNLIRYVKQQKLTEKYRQSYLNRFRLFRKLIQAKNEEELISLQQEIHQTKPISRPQWLLQKIQQRTQQNILT